MRRQPPPVRALWKTSCDIGTAPSRLSFSLSPSSSQSWPGSHPPSPARNKTKKKENHVKEMKGRSGLCPDLFTHILTLFVFSSDDVDDYVDRRFRLLVIIFSFCFPGPVDHITEALGSLTTASGESGETTLEPQSESLPRRPDPLTGLTIQQVHRKQELCQRHIQQLFIRGEQVALVAVLPL